MIANPALQQLSLQLILTAVIATIAVLGAIAGAIRYINKRRWNNVNSATEQEKYLRDHFEEASYGDGPLVGTVTNVKVKENSAIRYRIKKAAFAKISGRTEVTIRLDGAAIAEDRLDREPFSTLFSDTDRTDLVEAEHLRTQMNKAQGFTLVQIRISSIGYDEVGSWCAALPKAVWRAYRMEQKM